MLVGSVAAFVVGASVLTWRLYVGLPKPLFGRVAGLFAYTAVVAVLVSVFIKRWSLEVTLACATGGYAAILVATFGRPERMLDTWRLDGSEPDEQQRRSTRGYQWRFVAVVILGIAAWAAIQAL